MYNTPQFSDLKKEKFPQLSKWIIDSMDCAHRHYSEDELAEMDSLRMAKDSTLITSEPGFPDQEIQKEEDHDLRSNNEKQDDKKKSDKKFFDPLINLFKKKKHDTQPESGDEQPKNKPADKKQNPKPKENNDK